MNTDPIANAARLLREAAEELKNCHTLEATGHDWTGEPEAKAAYDEHMATANALELWASSVDAGGVEPLRRRECLHQISEPEPAAVAGPSADVQAKIDSNIWDDFGDILPTLKAISRGDWFWGANSRCKYIEIRLDTRDGGCVLYDRDRVRISPEQFAFQAAGCLGKMDPWPAKNALAAPATQAVPAAQGDALDAAFEAVRHRLCGMQRYSFVLDDDGVVRRVEDRTGRWIEFDDAHELFDPVAVDAARSQAKEGGAA